MYAVEEWPWGSLTPGQWKLHYLTGHKLVINTDGESVTGTKDSLSNQLITFRNSSSDEKPRP